MPTPNFHFFTVLTFNFQVSVGLLYWSISGLGKFHFTTGPIQTNRPLVLMEDPGIGSSVMNPASVVPPDCHHHPSIDFSLRTPFPIILSQDSDR